MKQEENRSDIVIYEAEDGQTALEVTLEDQTVWLSLNQTATLFLRDKSVIFRHLRNIFKEKDRVVERQIEHYNCCRDRRHIPRRKGRRR